MRSDYKAFCPKCNCYTRWCEYYMYPDCGGARAYCKSCRTKFDANGFGGDSILRYNDGEYLYSSPQVWNMQMEYDDPGSTQRMQEQLNEMRGNGKTSKPDSKNGCFLTTVVCQVLGFEDDCFALENLRKFRNEVLGKSDRGKKLLVEYKTVSDKIIPNILSDKDKTDVCNYVYNTYIMPVNNLVDEHKIDEAIDKYKEMVNYFIHKYKV